MRHLVILGTALVLAGCATVNKQPLAGSSADALKGLRVVQTSHALPDFAAMTAGKATFGILGAAAMVSEGNKIILANKVADPAVAIGEELAASLAARFNGQVVGQKVAVSSDDLAKVVADTRQAGPYVLDVQTINWSLAYFPTNWGRYRVIYTAKARLISTEAGKVVAEGFCKRIPESDVGAPTYDDLLASDARLLKQQLALAATECARSLKAEMFSL